MNYKGLKKGTLLFDHFRILEWVGFGSAGAVFSCEDLRKEGKVVAIKILSREACRDSVVSGRFRKEWEACQKVSHTNVIVAEEFFEDNGFLAFSMEYMSYGTLAELIEREGPLSVARALAILQKLTAGLAAIHGSDLIHRDLKPENVLVGAGDLVKISDFGVSVPSSSSRNILHDDIVGTMAYVSPEYIEHGRLDGRSDIYALGVIGYEMITGTVPFNGESPLATITSKVRLDPEPISSRGVSCPERLDAIILKSLARNPSDRYQDIRDLAADLNAFSAAFEKGEEDFIGDTSELSASTIGQFMKKKASSTRGLGFLSMRQCKAR